MNNNQFKTTKATFNIDGKELDLNDVPEEFRHLMVDADNNGQPDIIEEIFKGGPISAINGISKFIKASKGKQVKFETQKSYQSSSTKLDGSNLVRNILLVIIVVAVAFFFFSR